MNNKKFLTEFYFGLIFLLIILLYPFLIIFYVIRGIYRSLKFRWTPKSIKDEVALITGSGRGLGRLIAIELAKQGCHIAIVDVQGELAEETAKFIAQTYKVKVKAYKIDVTNYEDLENLKVQIINDLGDVTILINNAGILTLSSIDNYPMHEVQRMINVNFNAVVYTTRLFLPKMKQLNRGHIVNISSTSALFPGRLYSVYGATKSAVQNFTSSIRSELLQDNCNVTATTIMPSFLNTHPIIVDLWKIGKLDANKLLIDGSLVVEHIMHAMLTGADEMTIPEVMLYASKLIQFLPVHFREQLWATLTQRWMRTANTCIKIDKLLKSSTSY